MIRTLLRPRWLKALAGAVVFMLVCVWLGQWQLGRYEGKQARVHAIDRNYAQPPAPLREILPTAQTGVTEETLWRSVTMTGRYDGQGSLLVRNRPRDGRRGYEVVAPLRLADGTLMLVDRGWLPAGDGAATELPQAPLPPSGEVTVTGWLRWGEPDLEKPPAAGQLASINYTIAQEAIGGTVNHAYVVMGSEGATKAGDPATGLAAPNGPDRDEGWNNMSYFGQWWLFGLVAIGMVLYAARREHLEEQAAAARGETGADEAGAPRAPRPKKVRIWDEEDE